MPPDFHPFFHSANSGKRFWIHHKPPASGAARGAVLYLHPFAEEANKSRHVVALQARELATAGWQVLQIDLMGCGDSAGDFADATWEQWLADVTQAVEWLRARASGPLVLWGLRGGCLLAAEWLRKHHSTPCVLLFWHPVLSGRQHFAQFLRIRLAGTFVGKQQSVVKTAALQEQLAEEGFLEVAGYRLSADLARGLAESAIAPLPASTRILWLEVSSGESPALSPASQQCIAELRRSGCQVEAKAVSGVAFWQTVELEHCPQLLDATLGAMEGCE